MGSRRAGWTEEMCIEALAVLAGSLLMRCSAPHGHRTLR